MLEARCHRALICTIQYRSGGNPCARFRLDASAPGIVRILPQRHVGIHQRVGFFVCPNLKLTRALLAFEIREYRRLSECSFGGRSRGNCALRRASWPDSSDLVVAHQVKCWVRWHLRSRFSSRPAAGTKPDLARKHPRPDHRFALKSGRRKSPALPGQSGRGSTWNVYVSMVPCGRALRIE